MKLLLVEDDLAMAQALQLALERRGFDMAVVHNGSDALQQLRNQPPDLALLDLTIPGLDGLQVLHRARAEGIRVPIVVLTARGAVGDRVLGLNAGADDYLAKPFDLDELEARIRALLRRTASTESEELACGALTLELSSGACYLDGRVFDVTPREQALLKALIARPGHAVPKEKLFRVVFPMETDIQFEAIEVVAYRLRKKLAGSGVSLITLRGLGYLLRSDPVAGTA
ncbi:response regulator [Rhizobacter sp. OV335]|uniref:response regulator n=1 Tax=Rhizobacter sp. OV335 TaxID=1500264 RepID=UPI00091A6635|nr:response regulator [Rhizobacter sp. OV335]SHN14789.1 two-component system, OmpR family, response regulator TctD [Rhizobacter sp. OV335]